MILQCMEHYTIVNKVKFKKWLCTLRNKLRIEEMVDFVMLIPPRPVMFQSPYTQNSPKLFWNAVAVGFGIVTNWPLRLSQKSMPYLSGWRVAMMTSILLLLSATDKKPSLPTSRVEWEDSYLFLEWVGWPYCWMKWLWCGWGKLRLEGVIGRRSCPEFRYSTTQGNDISDVHKFQDRRRAGEDEQVIWRS